MPVRTEVLMGTLVTIDVVRSGSDDAIERAFGWFREIEARCSRFDERSEVMQLAVRPGVAVHPSTILFEAVRFALSVAVETEGGFDPTIGHRMETRGFDREDRTGRTVRTAIAPQRDVTYRDVLIDSEHRTITLSRPLILDLGAVVKGMAIDAAATELRSFQDFAIDAGGDLYLAGRNRHGNPWSVGIRHPRIERALIDTLSVTDTAVCSSGDYERTAPDGSHHILDPRSGESAKGVASVTVVAPNATLADALATAAFVLGPDEGLALLERQGVGGVIVTPALEVLRTSEFPAP